MSDFFSFFFNDVVALGMPPYTAMDMSRQGAWEVNKTSRKVGQTVASINGGPRAEDGHKRPRRGRGRGVKEAKPSLLFKSIAAAFFFFFLLGLFLHFFLNDETAERASLQYRRSHSSG